MTRLRGWLWPLGTYLLSRLVDAAFFLHAARFQVALSTSTEVTHLEQPVPASPGYFEVLTNWDGQWYWSIAEHGYPADDELGRGRLGTSSYAFYPLFPMVARLGMRLTGLGFPVVASLLATAFGLVAVVLLHGFVRRLTTPARAALVTAVVCFQPAGPVLQAAYSESLALLLLVGCLICLHDGRYGRLAALVPVLALTRGLALPLAMVVLVVVARRVRAGTGPSLRAALPALVVACAAPFLWPATAGVLGRRWDAYLLATRDWYRAGSDGWLSPAGGHGLRALAAGLSLLLVAVLLAQPRWRDWGVTLRTWTVVYATYILASTLPAVHVLRYLLALVPLVPSGLGREWEADGTRGRAVRATTLVLVCVVGAVVQYEWVRHVFTISGDPAAQPYP